MRPRKRETIGPSRSYSEGLSGLRSSSTSAMHPRVLQDARRPAGARRARSPRVARLGTGRAGTRPLQPDRGPHRGTGVRDRALGILGAEAERAPWRLGPPAQGAPRPRAETLRRRFNDVGWGERRQSTDRPTAMRTGGSRRTSASNAEMMTEHVRDDSPTLPPAAAS